MKKYYRDFEIEEGKMPGIDAGIITKSLITNLKSKRALSYKKIGNICYYTIEDIEAYLDSITFNKATAQKLFSNNIEKTNKIAFK